MSDINKIINRIYRNTVSLNLYVSRCTVDKERVLKEILVIKNDIDKIVKIIKVQ